ncbi:MAG: metal-sensitive transcriptional regulator [Actinobacteria bacterium]|nr:metal-sensitive transcriptional regulator [Actinomycetota bacterium]
MSSYAKDKNDILIRLKRMEGQLRGIQHMVEEGKYCIDILIQLSSIAAASQKVGLIILEDHIRGCVVDAISKPNQDAAVQELVDVVHKFIKNS